MLSEGRSCAVRTTLWSLSLIVEAVSTDAVEKAVQNSAAASETPPADFSWWAQVSHSAALKAERRACFRTRLSGPTQELACWTDVAGLFSADLRSSRSRIQVKMTGVTMRT